MADPTSQKGSFALTRWSVIVAAAAPDEPARREALETLLKTYWYPLFVFARKMGHSSEAAEDAVQGFFLRLIEKSTVADADPQRGRFRSFLLASFKHFLSNKRDREQAQKRGGGRRFISLDINAAEARYRQEPSHSMTAERLFDRRWVLEMLDAGMAQLRAHYEQTGRLALFEALKPLLVGSSDEHETYAKLAAELTMSPNAVKTAAHRMRGRCRDILRKTIAETVADESEVDDEVRHLFDSLKSP